MTTINPDSPPRITYNLTPSPKEKSGSDLKKVKGLATWEAVITLLSSNIGAGFVAIPYAFYNLGPSIAVIVTLIVTIINYMSI